jgi:hypothetical protein
MISLMGIGPTGFQGAKEKKTLKLLNTDYA